jgi:hypothetical protein
MRAVAPKEKKMSILEEWDEKIIVFGESERLRKNADVVNLKLKFLLQ